MSHLLVSPPNRSHSGRVPSSIVNLAVERHAWVYALHSNALYDAFIIARLAQDS